MTDPKFCYKDGSNKIITYPLDVEDGIAYHEIFFPKDVAGFQMKIEFLDCETYEKKIEIGTVEVGINELTVYHEPEK